jgi:glycopeptide antibiotics resistance protein
MAYKIKIDNVKRVVLFFAFLLFLVCSQAVFARNLQDITDWYIKDIQCSKRKKAFLKLR